LILLLPCFIDNGEGEGVFLSFFLHIYIYNIHICVHIFIYFGSTGVWTQGLGFGRQAIYHLNHTSDKVSNFLLKAGLGPRAFFLSLPPI
jgi:hypothetical protein